MLFKYGYSMLTVPVPARHRRAVRTTYRRDRRRGVSRHDARLAARDLAFYVVVADHPEFTGRPLAAAPDWVRGAA